MSSTSVALLQIGIVLSTCWLLTIALRPLGRQPAVVAQMVAGVVLGPSVLGLLVPHWQEALFPPSSLGLIRGLGQVGLVLYMFVIGSEVNLRFLRRRWAGSAALCLVNLVVPLLAGLLLGWALVHDHRLFSSHLNGWLSVGFFATSMAVTAFPVMAAIISEHRLLGTAVADLALAAGSVGDLAAWCLLALLLSGLAGDFRAALLTAGGAVAFTVGLLTVGRSTILGRLLTVRSEQESLASWQFVWLLVVLMVGGWLADVIGIHPAFGAFVLGLAVPRSPALRQLEQRLGPVVRSLLLPLYFVYAGVNTRISLVNTTSLVLLTVGIILVACLGKGVSCWTVARLAGSEPADALSIAALMNARGLVELVVLTIGLERGLITPVLFSIMVVMTIVTTSMASPLLRFAYRDPAQRPLMSADAVAAAFVDR